MSLLFLYAVLGARPWQELLDSVESQRRFALTSTERHSRLKACLEYRRFEDLRSVISLDLNADDAVLDGETVKLDNNGRPIFVDLMGRRGPFTFVAFDVLVVNGKDIRKLALADRKKILRAIVSRESRSVLYAQYVKGRGRELFDVVCKQDLEGIVAKHRRSQYGADEPRQWIKVKNPEYSQARDRAELFER